MPYEILKELSRIASKPFSQARCLPPSAYLSDEFLELEVQYVFQDSWICIGRLDDIPEQGDFVTSSIVGQPIFTIRNTNDEINSYSNICLHRMMTLLDGSGNTKRIVCPYHAWTYDITGQLLKAPQMNNRENFDPKDYRLPELNTDIWEGWIYVSLNSNSKPVSQHVEALQNIIGPYGLDDYQQIDYQNNVWQTNWKCLAENFMESYHLTRAHRGTIGPYSPIEKFEHFPGNEYLNYHLIQKNHDAPAGVAHPDNDYLEGDWRQTTVLTGIYPSHFIALAPDYMWYLSLQPCGVDKVAIRYGLSVPKHILAAQSDRQQYINDMKSLFDRVNAEDKIVVEGIFNGAKGILAKNGPLNVPLEQPNYEFYQFLNHALAKRNMWSGLAPFIPG